MLESIPRVFLLVWRPAFPAKVAYCNIIQMDEPRNIMLTKHAFGEDTFEEDVQYWRNAGYDEVFRAIYQLTALGYAMQGRPLKDRKIDKSVFIKCRAPWAADATEEEKRGDA